MTGGWQDRLAALASEQRDAERERANPHHGPSRRTWAEGVTDEDGWGMIWGGPVICDFKGGTHGTVITSDPVPPEGAIQFTRETWVTGDISRRVQVYMTGKGAWEHTDRSPCEHGPDVPLNEWTWVELPFTCRHGKQIRMKAGEPFYVDGLLS